MFLAVLLALLGLAQEIPHWIWMVQKLDRGTRFLPVRYLRPDHFPQVPVWQVQRHLYARQDFCAKTAHAVGHGNQSNLKDVVSVFTNEERLFQG